MQTCSEEEIPTDFFIPPVEIERLDTHCFRAHHLLQKVSRDFTQAPIICSPRGAFSALRLIDPCWMSQIADEYMHLLMKDGARSSRGRRMRKSLSEGVDKFDLGTAAALRCSSQSPQLPLFVIHARLIN